MIGWKIYQHTLKLYSKNYKAFFVTVAFPIVLTLIFVTVFSNLNTTQPMDTTIAIEGSKGGTLTEAYTQFLNSVGDNGEGIHFTVASSLQEEETGIVVKVDEARQSIELIASQDTPQVEQMVMRLTQSFANHMLLATYHKGPIQLDVKTVIPEQTTSGHMTLGIVSTMLVFVAMLGGQYTMTQVYQGISARGKRITVAPVNKNMRAISEYMAGVTVIMLEITGLLVVFELLFQVGFKDHWAMMMVVAVGLSLVCGALGICLGAWFSNEEAASGLLSMLITVLCIASGGLMPNIEAMPLAKYSPVTYVIEGIRLAVVRGEYAMLWQVTWWMGPISVMLLIVGVVKLRRREQG
ncbi:MAG: ABC transporter permease [Cellulosilyticaceae bacterium]